MSIDALIAHLDQFYEEYNTCNETVVRRMCKTVQDAINNLQTHKISLNENKSQLDTQKNTAIDYLSVYSSLLAKSDSE